MSDEIHHDLLADAGEDWVAAQIVEIPGTIRGQAEAAGTDVIDAPTS